MTKVFYDLHVHSCLSPCGDNDMTPNNIINMAVLKELDVIALTDHNTCKNCGALMEAGSDSGLIIIPGMELCTQEEIHAVCLFGTLDKAMEFSDYVSAHLPFFPNDVEVYGHQYLTDAGDNFIGEEDSLLVNATDISIMSLPHLMERFGGICFPAHIDKKSYSILSVLGDIPPECGFHTAEVARPQLVNQLKQQHPILDGMNLITNSDAHYLWDISERYYSVEVGQRSIQGVLNALSKR